MILRQNEDPLWESSGMHFDFDRLDSIGVKTGNLTTDSRRIDPGDTFLAYAGDKQDGRR